LEPSLCVVSSWVKKKDYTILIFNTISGSSNLDNCLYHCLILTLISHLKVLFNSLFYYIYILFIIYIVDLPMDRSRSCLIIYYFNTHALVIRHQFFDHVTLHSNHLTCLLSTWKWLVTIWMYACYSLQYTRRRETLAEEEKKPFQKK